jgi:hypothetical protein
MSKRQGTTNSVDIRRVGWTMKRGQFANASTIISKARAKIAAYK